MIDMIIERFGPEAIAGIAEAYRNGASDAEALEAGTGETAEQLFADFYAGFGVEPPQPIEPAAILPSNVRTPGGTGGIVAPAASPTPGASAVRAPDGADAAATLLLVPLILLAVAVLAGGGWAVRRRAARRADEK
jgi:hypothetical protein